MKKIILSLLSVGAFSCGDKDAGPVPVLDVTQKSFPTKDLVLQDIATVEYIPLETNSEFLLDSYVPLWYVDEDMVVTSSRSHIFFFDRRTGKGIRSFSRQGRGPGEYTQVGSIAVDRNAGEMYVTQSAFYSNNRPLYVYDLQGKHLRTLDFEMGKGPGEHLHIYDDGNLFSYVSDADNPRPYRLVSRTETVSTSLPVEFTGRENMSVRVDLENGGISFYSGGGTNVLKTHEGYIFSEPGVDTIYYWNKTGQKLSPLMALTPSFASMETPIAAYVGGQNSDYIFLRTVERKFDKETNTGFTGKSLIYDKAERQFYEGIVVNSDYADKTGSPLFGLISLPVGTFAHTLDAWKLVEQYAEGKLHGPLAEVASKLKEDDNPVLLIATFK